MSLDARLKQGLTNLADPIAVDYDLGLVRVRAVARQRERRNVTIAAFAGAVAAIALLALGGRVADLVLGIEVPLPTVVDPDVEEDGIEESDLERADRNDLRLDEALDKESDAVRIGSASGGLIATDGGNRASDSQQRGTGPSGDSDKQDDAKQPAAPTTREPPPERYTGAAVPAAGGVSSCEQGASGGACVRFETEKGERSVEISITDTSGGAVYAAVQIDRDADDFIDGEWTYICNETTQPVAIPTTGVAVVYVEIFRGTCQDGSDRASNPVGGEVTATFAT